MNKPEFVPLTRDKRKNLIESYGFRCKIIDNITLEIVSMNNEWLCDIDYRNKCIYWSHKNRYHDRSHEHPQRICYDFTYILDSIKRHESYEYNKSYQKKKHWDDLFEAIKNNTYNKTEKYKYEAI
jgi:hypothetical protein